MMSSSPVQGEPYLTSNVTTTVMHGLTDSSGNHVVVRVMNDGISVCCGEAEWRGRVVDLLPEDLQLLALGRVRDAHVVLHGIQRAEHEVEDAHRVLQLVRELLDDDRERPRDEVEHVVAEPEVGLLRQLLRLVRHAFDPVQGDDVPGMLQDERERAHGDEQSVGALTQTK